MSATANLPPETEETANLYRFTVEGLQAALKADIFDHPERMELVQGIVMEQPEPTMRQNQMTDRLSRQLRETLKRRFLVYGRRPLSMNHYNQPTVDIMAVTGVKTDYSLRHPTPAEAVLLVEVSDQTAAYDLGKKAMLYAEANIVDYWVVLVSENAVVVHREPTPSGYSSVTRLAGADTLSPLALPEAAWTIDTLLGREDAPEGK